MDFGDILDAWEGGGAGAKRQGPRGGAGLRRGLGGAGSGNAGKGGGGKAADQRVHPLTEWLRKNPVYDKDAELDREQASGGERRRRLLAKRADAALDLHGLSRDEAWEALEAFFEEGRRRGLEKLLIVHGKGNHSGGESVLKRTCRDFIERCSFAGESGHAPGNSGGSGATWVILREEKKRSAELFQPEGYRSR
ncbi:MAG: Smr/MutS family protein [Spirochaetaceae bacterium]|nr:Smr/MutS family protein [Spirochaetaceae bacterium]